MSNKLSNLMVFTKQYLDRRKKARNNFEDYIKFIKGDTYDMTWFHKAMISDLRGFSVGETRYQMLFAPPQHGKSEVSSRLLPSFLLGKDPSLKLAIVCYAATVAQGFSNDIQNIISSQVYGELFPETKIDNVRGVKRGTLKRNSYEVHTNKGGYFISVGIGGPLTSKTVDIAIIDDLYKDKKDAWSPIWRQRVWDWYMSVLETRLHSNSRVLILYTRWHEFDLAGVLLDREESKWKVAKYEIMKTGTIDNEKDTRKIGEVLWPARHNKTDALRWQQLDPVSFESLGQQNPKPKKGKMYPKHRVYRELPDFSEVYSIRKAYIDTADDGADFLSAVFYIESEGLAYITDIVFTQDSMEYTEPEIVDAIIRNNTDVCNIESNNGGKGFAREVMRRLREKGNNCAIDWFFQSDNKESRIFSNAAKVMRRVIFPHMWKWEYQEAYKMFVGHMREGNNGSDDFGDSITGIVEKMETITDGDVGIYFDKSMV